MTEKKEQYDAFAVPRNFGEDGISFNGLSRRNLAEGCILAVATGYPIVFPCESSCSVLSLCPSFSSALWDMVEKASASFW